MNKRVLFLFVLFAVLSLIILSLTNLKIFPCKIRPVVLNPGEFVNSYCLPLMNWYIGQESHYTFFAYIMMILLYLVLPFVLAWVVDSLLKRNK